MKHDMVMPKMGESITEGTIIRWLKQVGDVVEKDEIILEISTDKVDSEIPTPVPGKILEFLAKEGDTVDVGNVIARIDTGGKAESHAETSTPAKTETPPEQPPEPVKPAPSEPEIVKPVVTPPMGEPKPAPLKDSTRFYSPVVLNIARTEGIDTSVLDQIDGSGVGGRVTKKDVLNYLETKSSAGTPLQQPAVRTTPATAAPAGFRRHHQGRH